MSDESTTRDDSPSESGVAALLAKLCVVYALFLVVNAVIPSDGIRSYLGLTFALCVGGAIALLVVGSLMALHAISLRRASDPAVEDDT
jgi:formate hydrogenlyase subunit 3/multisubunit Na+/H+ antiporter MnhD subunit